MISRLTSGELETLQQYCVKYNPLYLIKLQEVRKIMEFEMSTKTRAESFEPIHIEEGIYPAELIEVKDISDGQYGKRVAFIYEIDGKQIALVAYKTTATRDNKLGQTLIAHGQKILDSVIDTDNLPNKKVNAWVEDYEKETKNDNGNSKKQVISTISKVKALVEKV